MNIQPLSGNNVDGTGRTPGLRAMSVNAELSSVLPDDQFAPDTALKVLLAEVKNSLQARSQLMGKMPTLLQEAVQDLLRNYLGSEKISQGLVVFTKAQKMLGEQLLSLASSLQDMATVEQSLTSGQKTAVASILAQTTADDHKVFDEFVPKILAQVPAETRTVLSQEFPQLPEVWAMPRLKTAFHWNGLSVEQLQQSTGYLQELATSLQKSTLPDAQSGLLHQVFSFAVPLYFGNDVRPYPAYIHIYNQDEERTEQSGGEQRETWLRICLDTENIGIVDVMFRLYQNNQVNLRVTFAVSQGADAFAAYVPDIRSAFTQLPLDLREVTVGKAVK